MFDHILIRRTLMDIWRTFQISVYYVHAIIQNRDSPICSVRQSKIKMMYDARYCRTSIFRRWWEKPDLPTLMYLTPASASESALLKRPRILWKSRMQPEGYLVERMTFIFFLVCLERISLHSSLVVTGANFLEFRGRLQFPLARNLPPGGFP